MNAVIAVTGGLGSGKTPVVRQRDAAPLQRHHFQRELRYPPIPAATLTSALAWASADRPGSA